MSNDTSTAHLLRPLLLIAALLLIPVVPFVLWGEAIEQWTADWVADPPRSAVAMAVAFGLLASDILLPVPSSVVCTFAGSLWGWGPATLVCFGGTTTGAMIGFVAARLASRWVLRRTSESPESQSLAKVCQQYGGWLIVLTRGLPVLAEASVLLVGLEAMRWSRFLPAVMFSNLGLCAGYAWLGVTARDQQWLPIALAVAAAAPVLFAELARRKLGRRRS